MSQITVEGVLKSEGLRFGTLDDHPDCAAIASVMNQSWKGDGVLWSTSEDDVRRDIEKPIGSNPWQDMLLVYLDEKLIGVVTSAKDQIPGGTRLFRHSSHLVPSARKPGLRRAMLHWAEKHLSEVAARDPYEGLSEYYAWAISAPNDWKDLLLIEGYTPRRHEFEMKRNLSENLPETQLPDGVEIRPVLPEHHRRIWTASSEALMDDSDFHKERQSSEQAYARWLTDPSNRLDLWTVAWEGDEVVGGVGLQIKEDENRRIGRKRAWTEPVFVRKPWRKRGIARALISRANIIAKEQGMEECALDVNTDNPSGALRLYESVGYRRLYEFVFFGKPVPSY